MKKKTVTFTVPTIETQMTSDKFWSVHLNNFSQYLYIKIGKGGGGV